MPRFELRDDASRRSELDVRFPARSLQADGTFAGYGSVFNVVDSYNSRIAPGAFAESIARKRIKMLRGHDPERVIGGYTVVKEDPRGLYLEGAFNLDVQDGRETYSLVKKGDLDGLSIGFVTEKSEDDKSGIRTITKVDLWEVSVVTFAANPQAAVVDVRTEKEPDSGVKSAADRVKTARDFEDFLRDEGKYSNSLAKRIASRGWKAATDPRDEDGSLSDLMDAVRALQRALSHRS